MNKEVNAAYGVTFSGLLQIAFIVLKILGKIDWSWWLVLLPTIIDAVLFLFVIIVGIIVVIVSDVQRNKNKRL